MALSSNGAGHPYLLNPEVPTRLGSKEGTLVRSLIAVSSRNRMTRLLNCIQTSLVVLIFATVAISQTPDTATIVGQAFDPTRAVVVGVHVTVTNDLTGLQRRVETDSKGKFSLAALPVAGSYTLTTSKNGF